MSMFQAFYAIDLKGKVDRPYKYSQTLTLLVMEAIKPYFSCLYIWTITLQAWISLENVGSFHGVGQPFVWKSFIGPQPIHIKEISDSRGGRATLPPLCDTYISRPSVT